VKQQAKELLESGQSVPEVARATQVKANTLPRAIRAGHLRAALKRNSDPGVGAAQ
jgi:transposase-like protein